MSLDPRASNAPLTKIKVVVCRPKAIAWCTKKSPGPTVRNKELSLELIPANQPGSQAAPVLAGMLEALDSNTSKP